VLAAWAVLGAARLLRGRPEAGTVVLAGALLLGSGVAGMLGRREHLFLLLAFPWIAARAAGVPAEGRLAVAAALLAGLGGALKPPFFVVLLAVEAVALLHEGPWRWIRLPGPWPLVAGPVAHALAVVLAFPAYLTDALPWLLGPYQAMERPGPWEMLAVASWGLWPAALALACVLPLLSLHERASWPSAAMAEPYRAVAETLAAERRPVVVLSPLVFPFHPALLEGRVADRTPAMTGWPAQAVLACPGAPGDPALTEWFRTRPTDRFRRGEVDAIHVDTVAPRPCPGAPTFGAWLRADPVLAPLVAGFVRVETRWRIEVWRPRGLPAGLSAP